MKLAELTVTGFADIVSSDAPAPGGGSCAALYGAIGAALTAMVGGLTQGRKKYAEYAEHAAEVEAKGNELKTRLLNVMDRDTDAFNVVSAAFGMPKDTDEEIASKENALKAAQEKLMTEAQKIGQALYAQQGAEGAAGAADSGSANNGGDDDVVDAEVVDDDDKDNK